MLNRFFVVAIVGVLLILTSCNTMEGLGQDVQKGGESLEGAAKGN